MGELCDKLADDDIQNTASPVPVPAAGTTYSYAKWTKITAISAPTGAITNLRWFADGTTWGAGVDLYAGSNATYTQSTAAAIGTASATVLASTYTAAAPLTITAGTVGTVTGTGTQPYVCSQVRVINTASAGITTARASNYVGAILLRDNMQNTALTGKPKSSKKTWQSRMVNQVTEKAIYRLIGSLMHGNTKSLQEDCKLNAVHPNLRMVG